MYMCNITATYVEGVTGMYAAQFSDKQYVLIRCSDQLNLSTILYFLYGILKSA